MPIQSTRLATFTLAVAALASAASVFAQNGIERKGSSCPSGYNQSGNYCVPSSSNTPPALHRIGGSCPSGYNQSADYCVGSNSNARHAMHRKGSCPSGYNQSADYCVKSQ